MVMAPCSLMRCEGSKKSTPRMKNERMTSSKTMAKTSETKKMTKLTRADLTLDGQSASRFTLAPDMRAAATAAPL